MEIIEPSFKIYEHMPYEKALELVEMAGRICYQSADKITDESAEPFIEKVLKRNHKGVIEHASISVVFIHNRGFSHELCRHRLASYCQESTRYVNLYRSGKDMLFIRPYWISAEDFKEIEQIENDPPLWDCKPRLCAKMLQESKKTCYAYHWLESMSKAENTYNDCINRGVPPQAARGVLPNDLKTQIMMTCNIAEWRHVLNLRSSIGLTGPPHADMIRVMDPLLKAFQERYPVFFADLKLPDAK